MRIKTTIAMVIIAIFALGFAASHPAIASDEEDVLQVAENLAKSAQDGDLDLASSLYWHSPEFTSFVASSNSPFLSQGYNDSDNDWQRDLPKGAITCSLHNVQATMLTDDVAIVTAYQIMGINPPLTEVSFNDQNRLTLVLQKIGGKWLIVHEHESHLPIE